MYDATFWALFLGALSVAVAFIGIVVTLLVRERKLESVFKVATSSDEYTKMCIRLNETHALVRILGKTPGIILPTERNLTAERLRLFDTIEARLKLGPGSYRARYLIDAQRVQQKLTEYKSQGKTNLLGEARRLLSGILAAPGLELRMADTSVITSMMIGGEDVVCMGYKERGANWNSEGYEVRVPELVKIAVAQFDALFNLATPVEIGSFGFD